MLIGDFPTGYVGDDVLAQTAGGTTSYLQYDGHGSTRLLTNASSAIAGRFDYDAYGKNLFSANVTSPASTDMLYSGEQFDPNLQMQYLRARYYDQNNGTFNRLDPFNGNSRDPQSLHKYAYCHGDPVGGIDPNGLYTMQDVFSATAIITVLHGLMAVVAPMARKDFEKFNWALPDALILGVQADAREILPIALSYFGEYWNLFAIPSFALFSTRMENSLKMMTGVVGLEIMINVNSAQLAVFFYGGAGMSLEPGGGQLYAGMSFSTPHVGSYEEWFMASGVGGIGKYNTGFFFNPHNLQDGAYGFTVGVGTDRVTNPSLTYTYYHAAWVQNLQSTESTIPWAAAFSMLGSLMFQRSPVISGLTAATFSFLPWFKYKYPHELKELQKASGY